MDNEEEILDLFDETATWLNSLLEKVKTKKPKTRIARLRWIKQIESIMNKLRFEHENLQRFV